MRAWNNYTNEIKNYVEGKIQTAEFSRIVDVQPRVARAFRQRYKVRGESIFIHGNTGKIKPRKKFISVKKKILDVFYNTRNDFNENPFEDVTFRQFSEHLEENGIFISETALKNLLKSTGYESPESCHAAHEKHKKRFLMEQEGELVQGDGSSYDWFGDGKKNCIQGFLDDATGIPVGLYMTENECELGYNEAFYRMGMNHGIPVAAYLDGSSIFFINQKPVSKDEFQEEKLTHFGSSMKELGVQMIRAGSPQAKGKIERFWRTLKYRLPVEFKLHSIRTVKEANEYLQNVFIPKYAKRFGRKPKSDISMFVTVEENVLRKILRNRYTVIADKNGYFTLMGYRFICRELKNQKINIYASVRDGIYASPLSKDERHELILSEEDSSGSMPQVLQNLINEFFMKDAKNPLLKNYYAVDADIA